MRRSSASKSRPPWPTITISPSTTARSGSAAARGATSSGKYRFIGRSSRLCIKMSSPSRNTIVRKPSHFGSNSQPSPPGRPLAEDDSIGAIGGANGKRMEWIVTAPGSEGRVAQEDALHLGRLEQLRRRPVEDRASRVEDVPAVGEPERQLHGLLDEDHADALLPADAPDEVPDVLHDLVRQA